MAFDTNFYDNIYFGLGPKATQTLGCDVSSITSYFYDYGLIGFLIILIPVYCIILMTLLSSKDIGGSWKSLVGAMLISVSIYTVNLYQRPAFCSSFYLIFLVLYVSESAIKKQKIKFRGDYEITT